MSFFSEQKITLYFFKIQGVIVLSITILLNFGMGGFILIEGYNIFSPYIDTVFAPDFTIEKSKKIKIGQTKSEVIQLTGQPLSTYNYYDDKPIFRYTSDGLLYKTQKNKDGSYDDFAWFSFEVIFDNQNKVIEINQGWIYD